MSREGKCFSHKGNPFPLFCYVKGLCFAFHSRPVKKLSTDMSREVVVLVHGFLRKAWDMGYLRGFFLAHGFQVLAPDLPVTTGGIHSCTERLAALLKEQTGEKIHFVGHSTGGRIVLDLLFRYPLPNLGHVVLIATPVGGSWCARKVASFPLLPCLFHTLEDLKEQAAIPSDVKMGVIAGGRGKTTGYNPLIPGDNDDLVAVDETRFEGMHDFLLVHHIHQRIHKDAEVAMHILNFLIHARFASS